MQDTTDHYAIALVPLGATTFPRDSYRLLARYEAENEQEAYGLFSKWSGNLQGEVADEAAIYRLALSAKRHLLANDKLLGSIDSSSDYPDQALNKPFRAVALVVNDIGDVLGVVSSPVQKMFARQVQEIQQPLQRITLDLDSPVTEAPRRDSQIEPLFPAEEKNPPPMDGLRLREEEGSSEKPSSGIITYSLHFAR